MGHGKKRPEAAPSTPATGARRGGSGGVGQPHGNSAAAEFLTSTVPVIPMVGGLMQTGMSILDMLPFGGAPTALSATADTGKEDVELARSQLESRFKILTPAEAKKKKDRAPNEITQAEFDRVARQFSDIRRGTSDLRFGEHQDQEFKDGAMNDIAAILQTQSGRRLIDGLTNNVDEKTGSVHHTTELSRSGRDGHQHAAPKDPYGTPNAVRNHHYHPGAAVPGTNMAVEYLPGKLTEGNGKVEKGAPWMPIRSDVTLFHELTHALHGTKGRQNALSSKDEELETVGLHNHDLPKDHPMRGITENAYREERAKIGKGNVGAIGGARASDKGMLRRQGYSDIAEAPLVDPKKLKR